MRELQLVSLLLLAGCPELVSVDDPRTIAGGTSSDASIAERGACTGSAVSCRDRSRAQCNSGCRLELMCTSSLHEHCATIRNPDVCDADTSCTWSLGSCDVTYSGACSIYESQTACTSTAPTSMCEWGNACTYVPTACRDITTSAACAANVGCTWMPK